MRGQHPCRGLTAADIPILIAFIAVNFAATVAVRRHATAGISGRSRFSQAEIAVLALSFAAAVAAIAGLSSAGVDSATYPTSVLVIPGLAFMVLPAIRSNRRGIAISVTILFIGIVGAVAGAAGSWAAAAWQQHART